MACKRAGVSIGLLMFLYLPTLLDEGGKVVMVVVGKTVKVTRCFLRRAMEGSKKADAP